VSVNMDNFWVLATKGSCACMASKMESVLKCAKNLKICVDLLLVLYALVYVCVGGLLVI